MDKQNSGGDQERNVLIFDLDGGTFVSLLSNDNAVFEAKARIQQVIKQYFNGQEPHKSYILLHMVHNSVRVVCLIMIMIMIMTIMNQKIIEIIIQMQINIHKYHL